ncbi:MAG: MotA/TolQ/ExbB proton channel family protein, partial [Candidatus Eisenbacteria bacterium]
AGNPEEKIGMRLGNAGMVVLWLALLTVVGLGVWTLPAAGQEVGEVEGAAGTVAEPAGTGMEPASTSDEPAIPIPQREVRSGMVEFFVKGGMFMWPLLACAVAGLAVILERLFTIQRAQTNTRRLMAALISELKTHGVAKAQEICMNTRGPIAAILHAGLSKVERGPAAVEKAIENSGAIEMAFLQRGLPVISTVVSVGPLLGFLGTVSGMIHAFEAIAAAEQVSAKIVANGIAEALITTLAGLVIAIPCQLAFNYFVSRVDRFVIEMEEASIELLDTLTEMHPSAG